MAADPRPDHVAAPRPERWECQVGHIDEEGDLVIFDATFPADGVQDAINLACEGIAAEDIEWVKVARRG